MEFLEIVSVSKSIRGRDILKDVSLSVSKGEILAVAGPPGSGKTTLLKIVAGLIAPSSGRVYLNGVDITDVPPHQRGFSMIFEVPPVYPDRTGYENIAFPLRLRKLSEGEIRKRVYEVAELLGITHILNRKPSTYSGGEYQRVALARALVVNPTILLLDEPLKNLDAKIREHMAIWLKQLQSRLGLTAIYSTHDPLEAFTIGNKVAVLLNGRVRQYGSAIDILSSPADLDVDEYVSIPATNVLKGSMRVEGNVARLHIDRVVLEKVLKSPTAHMEGEVLVSIRPSDIKVSRAPSKNSLQGRVEVVQYLGALTLATITLNSMVVRVTVPKEVQLNEGETIYISFDPDKLRVYDVSSRKRIL